MENRTDDLYGRQKLKSSCTLPYEFQWFEFLGSLPLGSTLVFLSIYQSRKHSNYSKIAISLIIAVEIAHALGHLIGFPYAEELIIFLFGMFNWIFSELIYDSKYTAKAYWRIILPTKTIFLADYILNSAILIYLYSIIGYLASTAAQSAMMLMLALTTPQDSDSKLSLAFSKYMRLWIALNFLGTLILCTEILYCDTLFSRIGNYPFHAFVDVIMGISVYFQCHMIRMMGYDASLENNDSAKPDKIANREVKNNDAHGLLINALLLTLNKIKTK